MATSSVSFICVFFLSINYLYASILVCVCRVLLYYRFGLVSAVSVKVLLLPLSLLLLLLFLLSLLLFLLLLLFM